MDTLRIVRRPEVETITGLSRSSIYAMMKNGTFPKNIKLGERAVGWPESAIRLWLSDRISASSGGA